MDLDQGTVVANRYRISRPLGRGGMGEVFAAENIRTGRPVAIKLLRQDSKAKSSAVARFRQEARAAGSINSDHVTQVLDVEEDPEHGVVLVFELLEGESLIDRLKRTGPIAFDELWPIIEQVWMGLADAHRAGIIHRDLKPSNVFLERRPDGTTRVKILDFGISKVPKEVGGETLTEMGQSLGTFSFMPPEQIGKAKTVDHRADIYACATLIYQSLTGQLPYSARNILVMVEMKTKSDARKLSDALAGPIDPRLEAYVAQGLSRDPSLRFPTALEALNAWRDLRPQGPSSAQPQPGSAPGQRAAESGVQHAASSAGSSMSASRLPSQPPPRGLAHSSPSLSRPAAPLIVESAGPIPRINTDLVELTTDETAATLAMPMPHLKKGAAASSTPPLVPRLDSATASIGSTGSGTIPVPLSSLQLQQAQAEAARGRPAPPVAMGMGEPEKRGGRAVRSDVTDIGPGGTQPVVVGRSLDHLAEARDEPKSGNLQAHPAGYYLPPAVQASLSRGQAPPAPGTLPPSGVPRAYDEPSESQPEAGGEGQTQVYRPLTDDTARRRKLDAAAATDPTKPPVAMGEAPKPPPQAIAARELARPLEPSKLTPARKSGVPLLLVLVGFLLVGFVVVAGVMVLFKR